MNAQLPLLKVAVLNFDKLVLLDPVGTSWAGITEGDREGEVTIQRSEEY